MTVGEVMTRLEALGDEKMRAIYQRQGAPEDHYGVKMGDLRALAKEIKTDHELALALWQTGNVDAMLLSTLIIKPKQVPADDLDRMVKSVHFAQLADWLMTNIVKLHPQKEALREKWMESDDVMAARAGWSLTTERVTKNPDGLDVKALLDRIEREMASAPELSQRTMNFCLIDIGVHFPEHRERALTIGEKLGVHRDYPVSKGCTSPFAPIAIAELVRRRG